MEVHVVGFIPPVVGVDGKFNTFRIGSAMFKRLTVGDEVFLMDEKKKIVFGKAVVTDLDNGSLGEMCVQHAHANHTQLTTGEFGSAERLFKFIQKIYGPHIAKVGKKATVIYLRRTE